ncbi:TonB-dependent siderophore receptor [Pseudooceanicola sp. LIPI14-2-Ac024]|uniref:TonB-dependent siderophore receptor n=1 Tax=Pseudooceanicola sp. LIPI14-2-Ac024 TaxID=3344875 RepID=UPI0035D0899C
MTISATFRLPHRRAVTATFLLSCTALVAPMQAAAQSTEAAIPLEAITVDGGGSGDEQTVVAQQAVSGSKTDTDILDVPATVSVVTAKEIEARGAQNLEQVIGYTAGVSVNEWGGDDRYDGFRIRGFDLTSLGLIYRDGLPQRGAGWTYARREPFGFERVEVLKGANSSLFGLSAPGGVINAVSKTPQPLKFGEVYTTVGPKHAEIGTDFGDVLNADGTLFYRITAKLQDAALSYDESNDDRAYLQAGLTWQPSQATSLTVLAEYYNRDGVPGNGVLSGYGIDRDTFFGESQFNRMDSIERGIGLKFSHDFGNGLTFRSNARYSDFDLTYEQVYGASSDPTADRTAFAVYSDSQQFAIDNQLQYDTSFGAAQSTTLLGVEYSHIEVNEEDYFGTVDPIDITDPDYCSDACTIALYPYYDWTPKQTNKAIYLQEELTFGNWIATIGGRYDWIDLEVENRLAGTTTSESHKRFSKRAGLTYKVTPETSVYANYSESFSQDVWGMGNDPTEGTQYEIGVKYRPTAFNALFTASVFDLTQTNVTAQVAPAVFQQIGEINVKGVELEGKMELTDRFNLIAAYSYWDAKITEDGIGGNAGNRPARTPQHIASLWADYTIPGAGRRGDINMALGLRYVGSTYGDDANTVKNDAYTLIDAAFGYGLTEDVALRVNVSNLLDTKYVTTTYYGTDYYGDGRKVTATLNYSW